MSIADQLSHFPHPGQDPECYLCGDQSGKLAHYQPVDRIPDDVHAQLDSLEPSPVGTFVGRYLVFVANYPAQGALEARVCLVLEPADCDT